MPAAPIAPAAQHAPYTRPPNPNHPDHVGSHIDKVSVTHQPSPAITSSLSHVETHVLPRRFLGPMPEVVVNSAEIIEKRHALKRLQRQALKRLHKGRTEAEDGRQGLSKLQHGKRAVGKVSDRLRGKGDGGDLDMGSDSDSSETGGGSDGERWDPLYRDGKKKRKKRKNVWIGESFDIGREFLSPEEEEEENDNRETVDAIRRQREEWEEEARAESSTATAHRPALSAHTTQETFVTARTRTSSFTNASTSTLHVHQTLPPPDGYPIDAPYPVSSIASAPSMLAVSGNSPNRYSTSSSIMPLNGDFGGQPAESSHAAQLRESTAGSNTTSAKIKQRLRSAIRKPTSPVSARFDLAVDHNGASAIRPVNTKSKTVQFPLDLEEHEVGDGEERRPRRGNKKPADPEDVLAREGDEVEGTSAGAVEATMADEDDDEDGVPLPGDVLMRGE
jgi:hypothetical protein